MPAIASRRTSAEQQRTARHSIASDVTLPMSATQVQAAIAPIYHAALGGTPKPELLEMLCVQLAQGLNAALVVLARKCEGGQVRLEAANPGGALHLAFHRIQECWDGGVASRGPASAALAAGSAIQFGPQDEGFSLWSAAAIEDRVETVLAIPVAIENTAYVIEIFSRDPLTVGRTGCTIGAFGRAIAALVQDIDKLLRQALLSRALESVGNSAFITDAHGTIVWTNPAFSTLTGYHQQEVVGKNPKILQSGHQGLRYYRELWSTIRAGKVWSGETVDRDKAGNLYTIRQTVSPLFNESGRVSHYISLHEDYSQQRKRQQALELASKLDPRTGLLTRAAFERSAGDALQMAGARQHGVELLLVSLRGLRRAAASLNADVREFLTDVMGRRLREVIPAPHLAAEVGSFEYAVLIHNDQLGGKQAAQLIDELTSRLNEPILYLGNTLALDIHLGRARFPAAGETFDAIWSAADRQLADEPVARASAHTV